MIFVILYIWEAKVRFFCRISPLFSLYNVEVGHYVYVKIRQKSIDSRTLHSANHHKVRFRPYYIEALCQPICYHARVHSCTPSIKIYGCVCVCVQTKRFINSQPSPSSSHA